MMTLLKSAHFPPGSPACQGMLEVNYARHASYDGPMDLRLWGSANDNGLSTKILSVEVDRAEPSTILPNTKRYKRV